MKFEPNASVLQNIYKLECLLDVTIDWSKRIEQYNNDN